MLQTGNEMGISKEKKKKKNGEELKAKEFWDVSNWLWEGLDADDELLIAYQRRPSEDMTSMCALCYKWFKSSDEFHGHMVTHIHTSRFHECSVCKKKFLARFLRLRHESMHRYDSNHPFPAYWGSEHCDFPHDYFVKNHPMKRFKPIPYTRQYINHLKQVEKSNTAEPISCICCLQVFPDYDELLKHYDLLHAIHQCTLCLEMLENFAQYQTHLKDKHKMQIPSTSRTAEKWVVVESPETSDLEQRRAAVRFFHNYADSNPQQPVSQPPKPSIPPVIKTYQRQDRQNHANATQKLGTTPNPRSPRTVPPSTENAPLSSRQNKQNQNISKSVEAANQPVVVKVETDAKRKQTGNNIIKPAAPNQLPEAKVQDDQDISALRIGNEDIEWVNNNEQNFPCQVCGRVFNDESLRNRHMRLHNIPGEKPFECKYCQKPFASHSNRKEHERIHTGERPYKCTVCDRRFIQISNLKKHMQTHQDFNHLQCATCSKQFVKESSLMLHQRSHATERKFRCTFCDRAYNYPSLLKRHMRIHTGECPYQCPDCQTPFHELVSLHYHRKKMHTGERPHKCEICGRGFILSSDLKKHNRIHLKDSDKDQSKKSDSQVSETEGSPEKCQEVDKVEAVAPRSVEDGDGDLFLQSLNPEVTLIVPSPSIKNCETLHYEIQDVGSIDRLGSDDTSCAYEAIEIDGYDGLQILSVKEVAPGEGNEGSSNRETIIFEKARQAVLNCTKSQTQLESDFVSNHIQKSNRINLPKQTNSSSNYPQRVLKTVPQLSKSDSLNSDMGIDEEPLLNDDSWFDV